MKNTIKAAVLFWACYYLFTVGFEFMWLKWPFPNWPWYTRLSTSFITEIGLLLIKVPTTYLIFLAISKFQFKKNASLLIVVSILFILFCGILVYRPFVYYLYNPYLYDNITHETVFDLNRCVTAFADLVFATGIAFAVKQYLLQFLWREKENKLVNEKLSAELKFLKAQINPHFLFNTLNNIYALARKKSEETPEVVLKLSSMLRYMLYETKVEKVGIDKEIQLLEDYIEIEKIRYSNRLNIIFTREIDNSKTLVAPLILLPFVENAFKHGASESRFDITITLSLKLIGNQLEFIVTNTKEEHSLEIIDNIGLSNVKRQLELTYEKYDLKIENRETNFRITLTISL